MEHDNRGIRLLKKGKKGILRGVFSRLGMILLLFLVQVLLLFFIFGRFAAFLPHLYGASIVFMAVMVLFLFNMEMNTNAKMTWLLLIFLVPIVGALLFWYTQAELGHRALKARMHQINERTSSILIQEAKTFEKIEQDNPGLAALTKYVNASGCFPIYENTKVTYFPSGEEKFEALLEQLREAKKFIFLEYFIIEEGRMWGEVLEILADKAAKGVEVRVMYDGMCEFALLSHDYPKRLKKLGIQCKMFAPITPFVSTHYNYRDHRKILVIDGKTAFTGGVNLADEYINEKERFGHWKDTAVMVEGEAAASFTLMFLQMWGIDEKKTEFASYLKTTADNHIKTEGFVLPYGDCPLDDYKVGENIFLDILNRAERYVHIMTPYLILDEETESALKFAAQRGVDVQIILPGIPDKKIAYALAKTHYKALINAGVKLYEYTLGFVHAKVWVSDDNKAVVGTINLDYRSLYHHFECAVYMYKTSCIDHIAEDFDTTLKKCKQVTSQTIKKEKLFYKVVGRVAKIIAPLM